MLVSVMPGASSMVGFGMMASWMVLILREISRGLGAAGDGNHDNETDEGDDGERDGYHGADVMFD